MTDQSTLAKQLRQMIAVLEEERKALAGLDVEALVLAQDKKISLCDGIEQGGRAAPDEECLALAESAKRLNEVNRTVRNLLAANVEARLGVLTGGPGIYKMQKMRAG